MQSLVAAYATVVWTLTAEAFPQSFSPSYVVRTTFASICWKNRLLSEKNILCGTWDASNLIAAHIG